jgi:DNA-binding response OmpR family regulator
MSMRVLVVDDDEHILRAMATSLTRAGFEVTTANDSIPAIGMTSRFDVVVADYNMKSEQTGADVVRHFKELHGAAVVCFVLSGEDDQDTREACLAAGAEDVLLKPVSPIELRRRLTDAAKDRGAV